jgi:hypothetical protein
VIDFERIVAEQTLEDILYLTRNENGFGYPQMDRFFSRYKFSVIESGEFMRTFEQMRQRRGRMGRKNACQKRSQLARPKFVTEKKYIHNFHI